MRTQTMITFLLLTTMALTVAGAAEPTMGPGVVISAVDFDEYRPEVAYNSKHNEYLVVWHDVSPFQARSIMGKRVDKYGTTIAEFTIAFEDAPPRDNAQPTVAYDEADDVYLVAWVRDVFGDDSDWDVYGRIIPWDGPDPTQTRFTVCDFNTNQWEPRVAWGGTEGLFMVTWWNENSGGVASYISAQTVTAAGALDGSNIVVSYGTEERISPDIAYNQARNEWIIAFQQMDTGGGNVIGVRLIGAGGVMAGGDFGIAAWPDPETQPRITASRVANEWAVVWQSDVPGSMKDVYARRLWVDGTGTVQMAAPVLVDGSAIDERKPDIAVYPENSEYLIVWEAQYSSSSGEFGIHGRELDTSNVLGAPFAIRPHYVGETISSAHPAVAASAKDFFAVWEQERNDTPSYLDIHGRAVLGSLFSDGFETGNTTYWSFTSP